jgi:hypothetical protein
LAVAVVKSKTARWNIRQNTFLSTTNGTSKLNNRIAFKRTG